MNKKDRLTLLGPIKKHWYLCFMYVFASFALVEILVIGSNMLAVATDELFSGGAIILYEFLVPFIVLMILGGILAFVKSLTKNTFNINMQTDIRAAIISKLVKIRQQYFDDEGTGTLMNKLLSDIYQIEVLFSELIPEVLVGAVTVAVVSVYIGIQSVSLLLVTVICYPLLLWIANGLSKKAGKVASVRRKLYDDLENVSYDAIQGILIGKSFNLYELQRQRILDIVNGILQSEVFRTKILAVNYVMNNLIQWLPNIICYLFCLYEVSRGRLTVGTLLAYVMLLDRMAIPMGNLPIYITEIREYKISVDRLQEILDAGEELTGMGSFKPVEMDGGRKCKPEDSGYAEEIIIEFDHVEFGYSEDKEVLKDISFSVKRGSSIAFVGSSGGGKTTVMKLLCGFYYPSKGNYRIYGHDCYEWDIDALRSNIGLVSQNVFLFPGTIAENVSYGKPGASREEITDACIKANIHDFIMSLPKGYDTEIGERGTKLSGGQKQRIAIARAFLKDAPILLMDEPTSSVDVDTEQGIQEALKRVSENRTTITVAHRLSTIIDADEIYVFDNGEIVGKGTHLKLLDNCAVYKTLYQKEYQSG